MKTSLTAAKPATAKATSARTLGLQAAAKALLAGNEQIRSELANTRMDYKNATKDTALATADHTAAVKLVNKAAALVGLARRAH